MAKKKSEEQNVPTNPATPFNQTPAPVNVPKDTSIPFNQTPAPQPPKDTSIPFHQTPMPAPLAPGTLPSVNVLPDGSVQTGGFIFSKQEWEKAIALQGGQKSLGFQAFERQQGLNQENQIAAQMAQKQRIAAGVGQVSELPQEGSQTIGRGIKSILPEAGANIAQNIGGGAALGALGGAAFGGVGAIPGAIIGGAAGGIKSAFNVISLLKSEQMQNVKVEYKDFRTSVSGLKGAIVYAKNGGDPFLAREMYNAEIARIYRAERNLQLLGEHEWLSKAKDELTQIEQFRRDQIQYDTLMQAAILNNKDVGFEFPSVPDDLTFGEQ